MVSTEKTKKRINLFDVVIILLVLSLIFTVVFRVVSGIGTISKQSDAKYILEFECDSEYNSLLNYVKNGDAVYFASNEYLLGYMYADENNEKAAIFEFTDDISVSEAEKAAAYVETEAETDAEMSETYGEMYEESDALAIKNYSYKKIKIGGQISLNSNTIKVKNGNYYVIGDINVTAGSVIKVYTDMAEFTITVKDISLIE